MHPDRWQHISRLYHAALERDARQRVEFLDDACHGDLELRGEIEALLARDSTAQFLFRVPAVEAVGQMVAERLEPPLPGVQIGSYRILSLLGRGGMGTVSRALDARLNRTVAIKFLADDLADAAARRRFQREAQMASSLNHPHILTVYDVGEFDGRQYIVTEFIDGGTLDDWAHSERRTPEQIVDLLIGVGDALATAHQAGILHRDIKPANILVGKNGYAKLVDFGLAKLVEQPPHNEATRQNEGHTRPGVVIGTIAYMSPEQASAMPLDARSDLFSFGVVLYELLTGRRPFGGATDLEVLKSIVHARPEPLPKEIPQPLRMIVEKALEKDPTHRYQTMRDLVVELRGVVRRPVASTRRSSWRSRWAAAAAMAAVLIGGATMMFRTQQPTVPATPRYVQLTNLDSATQPALSPDGRMMTFVRGPSTFTGEGQIYVKLLPDGDPVQLTQDDLLKMAPRFAPDGSRIAYSTVGLSGWEVWTVPVLGGQPPRRLLSNAEGLTWIEEPSQTSGTSPRILFSEATGKGITMAVISSTESRADRRQVFVRDEIMAHFSYLSPDRTQLLLAEMGSTGWLPCRLAPYDGSSLGKPVGPDSSQCTSAAWSPDGKWMYFSADTGGGFHIWRQRFPDGTPEQVTFGATEEEGVEFTPDGRSLLTSIGTRQSTLWIHDSRRDRQVTSDAYAFQPSFSADGKKLYYLVRTGSGGLHRIVGNLWVMDLESDARQRLLPAFSIEHYSVSRDGQRVAFVAAGDAGRAGVWVAALDGGSSPRRVASRGTTAFFGAGGDVVFGTQEGAGSFIYRVGADGANLRKAIRDSVHYGPYSVSPDGSHVVAWVQGSTEETVRSVVVFPLDGSAPTRVCGTCASGRDSEFPQPVSWSSDGKFVYLGFWANGAFAVPVRPGATLPPLPLSGIRSIQDAAALPGAQQFPVAGAFAGPNPGVYAYSKTSAQRNIYRVPVP